MQRWQGHVEQPKAASTIGEVIDHYLKVKEHTKSIGQIRTNLRFFKRDYAGRHPSQFTAATRRQYSEQRRSGALGGQAVSDRAVASELAYLRAALKLAEEEGMIAKAPKIRLPKNAGIRRRKRFLTETEYHRFMTAVQHPDTAFHIRLFVALALLTSERGIAIRSLKWEHVDFDAGVIWFSNTDPDPASNKNRQDMPITAVLENLLRPAQALARTEWVIEWRDKPVKSVKTGFKALCRRASISDLGVHDLRKTVATRLLHLGADLRDVAMLLGDDERVVRAHYAHVTPILLTNMVDLAGEDWADKGGAEIES